MDLFISEKLYKRIMGNEKYRRKFICFFWRMALLIACVPEAIVVISGLLVDLLPNGFLLILAGAVLAFSCAIAAGHWYVLHSMDNLEE